MTYKEIISQVQRRLGHGGFDSQLKADYQYAVNWAEKELMAESGIARNTVTKSLKSNQAEYSLRQHFNIIDFSQPCEIIIYDAYGNHLAMEEVPYDEWLRWNPTEAQDTTANDVIDPYDANSSVIQNSARYTNKLVVAMHFVATDSGDEADYYFSVKPALNGTLVLRYTVTNIDDVFGNLDESPRIPPDIHHFIVPGAVYFLAQIEAAQATSRQDANGTQFFTRLQATSFAEFQKRKGVAASKVDPTTKSTTAKAFIWYDNPRTYR